MRRCQEDYVWDTINQGGTNGFWAQSRREHQCGFVKIQTRPTIRFTDHLHTDSTKALPYIGSAPYYQTNTGAIDTFTGVIS